MSDTAPNSPRVGNARPLVRDRRRPPTRDRSLATLAGLIGLALVAIILALIVHAARHSSDPVHSPPLLTAPGGPNGPSVIEGPGGRVALRTWRVRKDPGDLGTTLGWQDGGFGGTLEQVPFDVNTSPVTGHAGQLNYDGSVAWFRSSFTTTQSGLYAIDFDSVNFVATVWVDGKKLGQHVGEYLPFEMLFGAQAGRHTLVVRVDWRDPDTTQTNAGFHRTWFNFGGIDGEVTVRPVGLADIQYPAIHTTVSHGQATVEVSVPVKNYGPQRAIVVGGTLSDAGSTIALPFAPITVGHDGVDETTARVTINSPSLWSPAHPNMYGLSLSVGRQSSYYVPVGLRQLTWSGGRLYLNGRRLILHGASIQEDADRRGDALTPQDQDDLVYELKRIGANATRTQHPLDPGLLERLDRAGILVLEGVGPVDPAGDWTSRTPTLMRIAEDRVRATVEQDQAHPSIIAWTLANEVAGNGHTGGQAQYVQAMGDWIHQNDPGQLVALDVWGENPPAPGEVGPMYRDVDLVGETNYSGWYNGPLSPPSAVEAYIRQFLARMHRTFPDKVQIISEFGAEANGRNPTDEPGGYDFQAKLLAENIQIYEHDPQLAGMLMWDLRDFALEPKFAGGSINLRIPEIKLVKGIDQKGLWTYENVPKPAMLVVARMYDALGGSTSY
ncbi:MAG TPA: glycoside hydrolase family 2 TIM barrel-domain containing protein [Solirubrobacteraceae bacterium]|nr:glycoside hydrolase family 2 TIM barrel-domain containing protein [Solirubrobacteraceae bacterium]